MSDSSGPHALQHARLPCPSLSHGVCSNSCPLYWWCYSTIWFSVSPLLFLPSIFPSIRVFSNVLALHIRWPKYWSFGISPSNEYSGLISFTFDIGLISLLSKGLSRVFCSTTIWKHHLAFFMLQLSHPYKTTGKTIALTICTVVSQEMDASAF